MLGIVIGIVGCLGFEGWALWFRRKHKVTTIWEATISEGVWFLLARSKQLRTFFSVLIVCLCSILGLHLAAGIP